jgi:iron complex transport system ATP-binding protein
VIELKDISAGYGKNIVLRGVSASFKKGKLTAIVGVNGCGKSTLLKAILGILPLTGGVISIDGKILGDMKRNEIARKAAYLAQGKNTPDMTVEQMVLHGRFPHLSYPRRYTARDREIAGSAMEQAGVAEYAREPLHALSGGMRQNAYIAMALAQDTEYILLDEPTTHLDIVHQLGLMRMLRALADGGKGVLAVMHDLPIAFEFSDEVLLLHEGHVAIQAAPQAVSRSPFISRVFGVELTQPQDGKQYHYRWG